MYSGSRENSCDSAFSTKIRLHETAGQSLFYQCVPTWTDILDLYVISASGLKKFSQKDHVMKVVYFTNVPARVKI